MNKTTYKDLIDFEIVFDQFLVTLGLPIKNNDRIHESYKLVRKFESVRKDKKLLEQFTKQNEERILIHALHDLNLMYSIIPNLKDTSPDILKIKFEKILDGTNAVEETTKNSLARNTLFEILLFSHMKDADLQVELCEPRPDILFTNSGIRYLIECKRIFVETNTKFKQTLRDAAIQLDIELQKNNGDFGLIALSIESIYAKGGKVLNAQNVKSAYDYLKTTNRNAIEKYQSLWLNNNHYIKNKKIIAVLIYLVTPQRSYNSDIINSAYFITISNTQEPVSSDFDQLRNDTINLALLDDMSNIDEFAS